MFELVRTGEDSPSGCIRLKHPQQLVAEDSDFNLTRLMGDSAAVSQGQTADHRFYCGEGECALFAVCHVGFKVVENPHPLRGGDDRDLWAWLLVFIFPLKEAGCKFRWG